MARNELNAPIAGDDGEEHDVGVLGWLGFIIVNSAAWGMIGVGHSIIFVIGFGFNLVYALGLMGMATWLEKRDNGKFRQFVNLLWVLAAAFVCVAGVTIAAKIGPEFPSGGGGGGHDSSSGNHSTHPPKPDVGSHTLPSLLPNDADAKLQDWAKSVQYDSHSASFVLFDDHVLFSGKNGKNEGTIMQAASNGAIKEVTPKLQEPSWFAESKDSLFFMADEKGSYQRAIWRINKGDATVATKFVSEDNLGEVMQSKDDIRDIKQLFVDKSNSNETLYFKVNYKCADCYDYVDTIFRSDATVSGTADLRGEVCSMLCIPDDHNDNDYPYYDRGNDLVTKYLVVFLGLIPMMALSGFVMATKHLHGPVLNLYIGVIGVVVITHSIMFNEAGINQFLKWFLSLYSAVVYIALGIWSLQDESAPHGFERPDKKDHWLEELRTWSVAVNGILFCFMVHIVLEVPITEFGGSWFLYSIAILVQLFLAALLKRIVPMICGAQGLFVMAWYIATKLSAFADFGYEVRALTTMAILAVQGVVIIAGAIYYSKNRMRIERFARAVFTCDTEKIQSPGLL